MDKLQLRLDPAQSQLIVDALSAYALACDDLDAATEAGKLATLVAWRHAKYFSPPPPAKRPATAGEAIDTAAIDEIRAQ